MAGTINIKNAPERTLTYLIGHDASDKGGRETVASILAQLPPMHDTGEAANEAAMLALVVTAPAMIVRTDFTPHHIFFLSADPASTLANWHDMGELGAGGANPTAQAGLTPVNGVAATFMRSDGAPAINQAIAPTWTGQHIFSGGSTLAQAGFTVKSGEAQLEQYCTGAPVDAGRWNWVINSTNGRLTLRALSDTGALEGTSPLAFTRAATTVTGILSDSGSGIWAHTGSMSITGTFTATAGAVQTSWNAAAAGSVLQLGTLSAHNVNIATDNVTRMTIAANGDIQAAAGYTPANPRSLATKEYVDQALPHVVAQDAKAAQAANVNAPNIYAVTASGFYRVSTFVVITQAATTSATMPAVNVAYTEANTGAAVQDLVTLSTAINTVGAHSGGTAVIQAQTGSQISYSTSGYASSGATPMQYRVAVVIERLQ